MKVSLDSWISVIKDLSKHVELSRINVFSFVVIFLSSLTMLRKIDGSLVALWDSVMTPFNPKLSIEMDLSLWDSHTLGGKFFGSPTHFLYHAIVYTFSLILSVGVANAILFWFLFLISGISMYLLIIRTLRIDNEKEKVIIALISSLVYMFNPYWIFQLDTEILVLFILAFLPLLILTSKEALISVNTSMRRTIVYSVLTSFVILLMTPGLGYYEEGLVTALFLVAYLTILSIQRRKLKPLIVTLVLITAFSALNTLWWTMMLINPQGTIKSAVTRSGSYVTYVVGSLRNRSQYMNYFDVLRGMGYYIHPDPYIEPPHAEIYNSPLFVAISVLVPIVASFALLSKSIIRKSDALAFIIVTVIFIPLFLTGLNPPFNSLVLWLIMNVPFYIFSRSSSFMFILHFTYAYMFGLGILSAYYFVKKSKVKTRFKYSIIVTVLILVIVVLPFPEWLGCSSHVYMLDKDGNKQSVSILVEAPDYVKNLINYLNGLSDDGGVLVLPKILSMRAYDWDRGYFGFDPYYLSLERPILTHYMGTQTSPQDVIYDLIDDYDYVNMIGSKWTIFESNAPKNSSVILNKGIVELTAGENRLYSWSKVGIKSINPLYLLNNTVVEATLEAPSSVSNGTDPRLNFVLSRTANGRPADTADYLVIQLRVLSNSVQYQILNYKNWSGTVLIGWTNIPTATPEFRITFQQNESGHGQTYFEIDTSSGFSEISGGPWDLNLSYDKAYISCEIDTNDPVARDFRCNMTVIYPEGAELPIDAFTSNLEDYSAQSEFSKLLTLLGIQYIIVVEDALGWDGKSQFNIFSINNLLSESEDVRLVARFGHHVLYETENEPEMFYPVTRIFALSNDSTKGDTSSLDILNLLLKYKNPTEIAFINNSNMIISNETTVPTIISEEGSSSSFHVQISNASAPFLLVSCIFYDEGWVAEVNGKQLEHLQVDGLFNGWVVNETGSFTANIYFKPQQTFNFALSFSFISVIMECLIVLLCSRVHKKFYYPKIR